MMVRNRSSIRFCPGRKAAMSNSSFVQYMAGTLEGKKIPAIRKAWVAHVRMMLRPSEKTTVPQPL
jgi:hypothetical protein